MTGTKKIMQRRLELYRLRKSELIEQINKLTPNVDIPKIYKKELVAVIPKIEDVKGMTLELLKEKVRRMHHYVHEMPAENSNKNVWERTYAEALINKRVGLLAESDEEHDIDLHATRKDLLHALNNIDPLRIKFSPVLNKAKLINLYQKYVLKLKEMTKNEIRDMLKEKYPEHVPLIHAKKVEFLAALAGCMFEEEFGGKITDNPKILHVHDLKAQLSAKGVKLQTGLLRKDLEELYEVFVYGNVWEMQKRDIRDYLHHHGVTHHLTQSNTKEEHVNRYHEHFRSKYGLEE